MTDCDRLDEAFQALEGRGILALQNAGYTMSDGHDDAREVLIHEPGRYQGYCFYHGQDLERAVEGRGLMIAFGHAEGDVPDKVKVGLAVKEELERVGFATEWDGTADRRINVPGIRWERRYEGSVVKNSDESPASNRCKTHCSAVPDAAPMKWSWNTFAHQLGAAVAATVVVAYLIGKGIDARRGPGAEDSTLMSLTIASFITPVLFAAFRGWKCWSLRQSLGLALIIAGLFAGKLIIVLLTVITSGLAGLAARKLRDIVLFYNTPP